MIFSVPTGCSFRLVIAGSGQVYFEYCRRVRAEISAADMAMPTLSAFGAVWLIDTAQPILAGPSCEAACFCRAC